MKKTILSLGLLLSVVGLAAQSLNVTLRDQLSYPQDLNDVWGYVAPDGTEYALVGTRTGLSIVSLADPDNVAEVAFVSGANSTWRDIKTYGNYAYVVADQGADGLVAVDLSNLPTSVTSQNFTPTITGGSLDRAHNIYIDVSTGLAYLAGANRNGGGMIIFDVATNPGQPSLAALAPSTYAHDVYVQDDVMYASEIGFGRLNIYDVSDLTNIISLGTRITPLAFTHNAWTESSGNYVYTTDERPDAPVAAYDITDPSNPVLIDEFFPERSVNTGTIPHNVHVINDYLVISHYTDGVEIVDASVPDNLVEVGYYDTWSGANGGFNGTWGAYPFLPSGLVLGTDIDNGLFVLDPTYIRAARIRGTVTDGSLMGPALNNVMVTITNPGGFTTVTDAAGLYRGGFVTAGNYTVSFSLPGYNTVTTNINFTNGVEVVLDTFLTIDAGQTSSVTANVISSQGGAPIPGAEAVLDGPQADYAEFSDGAGQIDYGAVLNDSYLASFGAWGFQNRQQNVSVGSATNLTFVLDPGYLDGFVVDQGWTTQILGATTGHWERGVPIGTSLGGTQAAPGNDAGGLTDIGNLAWVTGNGGGSAGNDDIDGGQVVLVSPVIDLTLFPDPSLLVLSYDYYYFTGGGNGSGAQDELIITLDNGLSEETIATYVNNTGGWINVDYELNNLGLAYTGTLQLRVYAADLGNGQIVEAGFDDFRVFEDAALPVRLANFTATKLGEDRARLNWTTLSEDQNDGFAVERSINGRDFSRIGWVDAAGGAGGSTSYVFDDPAPASGLNYYRLRQLDLDGTATLSQVETLTFGEDTNEITVFPNPVTDRLYLRAADEGAVEIIDAKGRRVAHRWVAAGQAIDVSGLSPGTYWLRVNESAVSFLKQ